MRKGNIIGIILILAGAAWILNQTGVLSVNWVASVKALWPIVIVAIGVSLMAGHRRRLVTGVWILAFLLFVGFGIYKRNETTRLIEIQDHIQYSLDFGPKLKVEKKPAASEIILTQGTEESKLILQLGAVNLDLSEGENHLLVKMDTNIPNLEQRMVEGKQTILEYGHPRFEAGSSLRTFELQMNPTVLWEIEMNLGAVDGKLDFTQVPLKNMEMNLGAGSLKMHIGKQQVETGIRLNAGVADLSIYIPEGAGLKVKSGKLLSDLSFHNMNMVKQDQYYISDNYETARQKIDLDIQTALSSIQILAH